MTTEVTTTEVSTIPVNKVIVIGMLDTMLVRDRDARRSTENRANMVAVTRKEGRTRGRGGRWENLTLQVRSPYGGMFAMPIEIEPDVLGAELLHSAPAETMLAIEGTLQLKQTFDGRYASDRVDFRGRTDRGRPTRELQLLVSCVREPNEQERRASSAVWLVGEIAEPPQISRHPDLPSIQLAGTILRVAFARPADFPGVPATIQDMVEVNVSIPTTHENAEKLYRQGNAVRVIGQLDCRMEYQGGEAVRTKLAEIDTEWVERKTQLADKPAELRHAEATYRRVRERYEAAPRLFVLAGYVELVEGEPMMLDETFQARRDFVQNRRRKQDARRARTAADKASRAAGVTARPDAGESITELPVIAAIADVGMDPAVGTTKSGKPRRHVGASMVEPMTTQSADASVNDDAEQP